MYRVNIFLGLVNLWLFVFDGAGSWWNLAVGILCLTMAYISYKVSSEQFDKTQRENLYLGLDKRTPTR